MATVVLIVVPGFVVAAAAQGQTLGFDFLAYHQAAARVLAGEPLYDPTVQQSGGFGLFYYPPPFVLAVLPFGVLSGPVAVWLWLGLTSVMLVVGTWLLPVRSSVRWATLLLAGLSWPVAYALKLGQVGPILFLLFAAGWRWLDRPVALGLVGAVGAIVKIQPGIVLAWALATRRWPAVVVGSAVLVVTAAVATLVAGGLPMWSDYVTLLRNVSDPITTPHNFTPGAVAYQLGVPSGLAATIQVGSSVAVVAIVLFATFRLSAAVSYATVIVASQLLSPILWDHYAMLLLIPVALLLERAWWPAVVIPLATSVLLLPIGIPAFVYPLAFWATMLALLALGLSERRRGPAAAVV